jgi:signal transduction histidine kinase
MSNAPRVSWTFAVGAAGLLTVLFAVQNYLSTEKLAFGVTLVRQATIWGAWLLLVPWIVRIARRHPLDARPTAGWVWRQLFMGGGFAILHGLVGGTTRWLLGVGISNNLGIVLANSIGSNFARDYLSYWFIAATYQAVIYHGTVRERDASAARLQLDLAHAKLQSLEGRLRPHFLFNTLNSIAALIREDPAAAETMIGQLSDLLRASLRADPAREVSLNEELALVTHYLAIEQARFQERLQTTIQASDVARQALVPLLILQPIVENAVRHGIAPRESGGAIAVHAARHDGRLRLIVEDDGIGIGCAPSAQAGSGIGLGSVRARLTTLYGDAHRLDVDPRWPSGTRITIELPYRTAGESPSEMPA